MNRTKLAVFSLIMAIMGTSTIFPMFKSMEAHRKIQGIKQDVKAAAVPALIAFGVYKLLGKNAPKLDRYGAPCLTFALMYWVNRHILSIMLFDAIEKNDEKRVTKLLLLGVNPRKTVFESTVIVGTWKLRTYKTLPLMEACKLGTIGIARRLLKYGACPSSGESRTESLDLVPFSSKTPDKLRTPLHQAGIQHDLPMCTLLVEHGADVNALNEGCSKVPPLSFVLDLLDTLSGPKPEKDQATALAGLKIFGLLIDNGADVKKIWTGTTRPLFVRLLYRHNLSQFKLDSGMTGKEFLIRKVLSKYDVDELQKVCAQYSLDFDSVHASWLPAHEKGCHATMLPLIKGMRNATPELFEPKLCNEVMAFLIAPKEGLMIKKEPSDESKEESKEPMRE
jgi:hypothetical protein